MLLVLSFQLSTLEKERYGQYLRHQWEEEDAHSTTPTAAVGGGWCVRVGGLIWTQFQLDF